MRRARHGGHTRRARTSGWTAALVVALIALGGGTAALAADDPVALETEAGQAAARAQQLQQTASLAQAAAVTARSQSDAAQADAQSKQSAFSAAGADAERLDGEADDQEARIEALRDAANARNEAAGDPVPPRIQQRDQAQANFNAAPTPENEQALRDAQDRLDVAEGKEERADDLTAEAGEAPDTPAATMTATADGLVPAATAARQEAAAAAGREAAAQAALEAAEATAEGLDRSADDAEEDFRDAKSAADRATADATTLAARAREARAAATPVVTAAARPAFLTPFPIVRIRGRLTSRGAVITLLSVRAPRGARVAVTCKGGRRRGCPGGLRARTAASVSFPAVRRHLRSGAVLEVRVTRPGTVGKYTRFTVRKGKSPLRRDSCLLPGSTKPARCPSK